MEARKREAWAARGKVTRRDPARTKSPVCCLSPLVAFSSAASGLTRSEKLEVNAGMPDKTRWRGSVAF